MDCLLIQVMATCLCSAEEMAHLCHSVRGIIDVIINVYIKGK